MPIKENVNTVSNITEKARPRPRRWRALSTGLSRKVSKIATATGIRTARAQYIEARTSTSVPKKSSNDISRDFAGTKRLPFLISIACGRVIHYSAFSHGVNTPYSLFQPK